MKRGREQRISDPHHHPRRTVSLVVAAEYLEVDRKTLAKWLEAGLLGYVQRGQRRRIPVAAIVEFERRQVREARV